MANPFDQFDSQAKPPAAPVVLQPGQNVDQVAAANAPSGGQPVDASNPFNDPAAALAKAATVAQPGAEATKPLSNDEFQSQFYDKLNAGDSVRSLVDWSKGVGHQIEPNENFYANIRIRDAALKDGKKGQYGRVETRQGNEPSALDPVGDAGALLRQGGNTMLFNFGDEGIAGLKGLADAATSGKSFSQAYADAHKDLETRNALDWELHPATSAAGVGIGALMTGAVTPSALNIPRIAEAGLGTRTAVGVAQGAAEGALNATGEGTPEDRFKNTSAGATIGGLVGGAVSPAVAAIQRIGRPIIERMAPDGAAALARRLGYGDEQINAAQQELQRQRALGVNDSSLLDVIDEPGRSVIGSAGAHPEARQVLQDVAQSRQTQLPERVGAAADEIVAPVNRPVGTTDEIRSGLEAQRDHEIETAMDAPVAAGLTMRNTPVTLHADTADVLGTTLGQQAIRKAINETTDAGTREDYASLQNAVRARARMVDPRLSESAQQAAADEANRSLAGAPFTIGMSEKIGRKLNEMGRDTGNGTLFSFGRTVRSAAEDSPAYRDIMSRYGDLSRASSAAGVGSGAGTVMDEAGRVSQAGGNGTGFLAEPASRFEQRVEALHTTPLTDAQGAPLTQVNGQPAPSEVDLARIGAAEQVRTKAGAGPSEASGVASQLYDSPEQQRRSVALLGQAGADQLAGRMREEVQRVYRASRQATKEAPSGTGGSGVESGINALHAASNPVSALKETARFLHRIGMTQNDALWITRNATDPSQTGALIDRLRQAGVDRTRARAYTEYLRQAGTRYFTSTEDK